MIVFLAWFGFQVAKASKTLATGLQHFETHPGTQSVLINVLNSLNKNRFATVQRFKSEFFLYPPLNPELEDKVLCCCECGFPYRNQRLDQNT